MIAATAATFFAENATSARTRAVTAAGEPFDEALWDAFAGNLGLAGVALPTAFCGSGLGHVEIALIAEAAGAQVAALPFVASIAMVAAAIRAGGSDAQQARWLPVLAVGSVRGAFVESDVRVVGGQAHGVAPLVVNGGAAALFLVEAEGGAWLVERADGVAVEAQATMDQTRPIARVAFNGVPAEPLAHPAKALTTARRGGWIALAADALGGAEACLRRTVDHAKQRIQFGRAIGSFQAVKHQLADMMVEIEQARSAVYWAACAADEDAPDAMLAAHAAKALACDTYAMCAGAAIQLHGGIGFTWEHDAHLFFKRAQANRTWLGTPEWHRERIARLLGLGGER